ncbi:MAG: transposase [Alcanivoracaceae bacterium]|nr:transposase [Alcanivoracaceae bacterium]
MSFKSDNILSAICLERCPSNKSLHAARYWVDGFVKWYNQDHRHSSIKFVTPNQCLAGLDVEILRKRKRQ